MLAKLNIATQLVLHKGHNNTTNNFHDYKMTCFPNQYSTLTNQPNSEASKLITVVVSNKGTFIPSSCFTNISTFKQRNRYTGSPVHEIFFSQNYECIPVNYYLLGHS